MERWVLRLQAYHFKAVYRPGKTNIADALFRLNCGFESNDGEDYDFVHAMVENSVPCALTPAEIEKASAEGMELNLIKKCVQTGDWSQCNVPAYLHVKNELCMYSELLLRGSRLVIPRELRPMCWSWPMRDIKVLLKLNVDCAVKYGGPRWILMQRSCAGVAMDVKQLGNMLPQNLWLELFCPVVLGRTVQLTF